MREVRQWGSVGGSVPVITVEPSGIVKGDGEKPGVGVDGDERKPVAAVHPVAREVDPQRRLRQLRGHLLRRQRHLPRLVRVAVQAQVLLVCSSPHNTAPQHKSIARRFARNKEGIEMGDAEAQLTWIALRVEVLDICQRNEGAIG
jgi:hypothetical protein